MSGICQREAEILQKQAPTYILACLPWQNLLKKGLSGKYILVFTCPNGQADFLNAKHNYLLKMAQIPRNIQTIQQN